MDNMQQLSVDMYMRDLYTLKKSNLLIEKINTFSFNTHKIFNLILWEFQRQETPTHHIQMPVHKMVELVGKKEVYRTKLFYQKIAKNLVQKTLDLIEPQENAVDVTNLISRFTLEKGMIDIRVTDEFLELAGIHKIAAKEREIKKHAKLAMSAEEGKPQNFAKDFQAAGADKKGIAKYGYTKLNLCLVNSLKSKHSMTLYEYLLMKLHFHTFKKHQRDFLEIPLDLNMLRKMLCHHQKSYEDFDLFHRKILKVAIEEINEKTDLVVEIELQKSLNKVHAILFSLRKKKDFILQIEGSSGMIIPFAPHQEHNTFDALGAKPNLHSSDAKKPMPQTQPSSVGLPNSAAAFVNTQASSFHAPAQNSNSMHMNKPKALDLNAIPSTLSPEVKDMILEIKNDPHQQALQREAQFKKQKTHERHQGRMQEMAAARKNGTRYTGEDDTQDYFQPIGGVMGNVLDNLMAQVQANMNAASKQAAQKEALDRLHELDYFTQSNPNDLNYSNHASNSNNMHGDVSEKEIKPYIFDASQISQAPKHNQDSFEKNASSAVHAPAVVPQKYQAPPTHLPVLQNSAPINHLPDVLELDAPNLKTSAKKNKKKKLANQAHQLNPANPSNQVNSKSQKMKKKAQKNQTRVMDVKSSQLPVAAPMSEEAMKALKSLGDEERVLYDLLEVNKAKRAAGEVVEYPENIWNYKRVNLAAFVYEPEPLKEVILSRIWAEKKACLNHMRNNPRSVYSIKPASPLHAQNEFKKAHPNQFVFSTEFTCRDQMPYYSIGAIAVRLNQKMVEDLVDELVQNMVDAFAIFRRSVKLTALGQSYDISNFDRIASVARDSYDIHLYELDFDAFPEPEKRFLITYNIIKDQYLNKARHECKLLFVKIFNNQEIPELTDPIKQEAKPLFSDAYRSMAARLSPYDSLERLLINYLRVTENTIIYGGIRDYCRHAISQEWHVISHISRRWNAEMQKLNIAPHIIENYIQRVTFYFEDDKGHEILRDDAFYTQDFSDKNFYISFNEINTHKNFNEQFFHTIKNAVRSLGLNINPMMGF